MLKLFLILSIVAVVGLFGNSVSAQEDSPTNLALTASGDDFILTWDTPSDNGSPITRYVVHYLVYPSENYWVNANGTTATSVIIPGLEELVDGQTYYFIVSPVNAAGGTPWTYLIVTP